MQFALLTNQVRGTRRPPLLVSPVDAAVLARMFPGMKKPDSRTSRAGKSQPAQASPARQPNHKNTFAAHIPMEVFCLPDRTSSPPQTLNNGRRSSSMRNGQSLPQVQPFLKPAPVRVSRNNPVRPADSPKTNLGTVSYPPSIPIPRQESPEEPHESGHPEPASQPGESASPPALAIRPAKSAEPSGSVSLNAAHAALGLHRLMERHPDLPGQSILLGACEDGWPLMLNLLDPSPGAMLVIGDERNSQLDLLRNAIDSAVSRNSPRKLQFLVISHQPKAWRSWVDERGFNRYCLEIVGSDEEGVPGWVLRVADWTEQRRLGKISGPPILLVMDTLSFLSRLPSDVRLNFDWMVKEGPPAQIWPLGTISTELATSMGARTLRLFQSHILGFAKDPQVYAQLVGLSEQEAMSFNEPRDFAVKVDQRLIHFRLPV